MKKTTKKQGLTLGIMGFLGLVLVFLFMPKYSTLSSSAIASENRAEIEQVELQIEGMTCRKCIKPMRKALLALPGVTAAEVSYADANAFVELEKGKVSDQDLMQAIEAESGFFYTYKAKVLSRK